MRGVCFEFPAPRFRILPKLNRPQFVGVVLVAFGTLYAFGKV
jgi:hypothetical protein